MHEFTQDEINEMLTCPKIITSKPSREYKSHHGHMRNNFEMMSCDGRFRYSVFIRFNEKLSEFFSIGMNVRVQDSQESMCLMRCNSRHGDFNRSGKTDEHYIEYHIHRTTEKAIREGLKPEAFAEVTKEYATWEEALYYFLENNNIENTEQFFPDIRKWRSGIVQLELPGMEGETNELP